jgi:hypothetical protein
VVSQKQRATQKQITVVNINTQRAAQRRRSNAVSAPPPPVFRGGYQPPPPPPPPPPIPLPPPPDLYETNRLRERVAKLERVNVVNRMPLKPPVKSAETQTAGVAVRERPRLFDIDEVLGGVIRLPEKSVGTQTTPRSTSGGRPPPIPPPPPPVAADPLSPPSSMSRATTEDIRGNERGGTEIIVQDHRGSFRDFNEAAERERLAELLAEPDEPVPRVGDIRGLMARVGGDVMDRQAALAILEK